MGPSWAAKVVCVCGVVCACGECHGASECVTMMRCALFLWAVRCGLPCVCCSKEEPLAATQAVSFRTQAFAHFVENPTTACPRRLMIHAGPKAQKHLRFESNVAVLHGMCHESVLCIGVQCAETCCLITIFTAVRHCSSKWAQNRKHVLASLLHTTIPGIKQLTTRQGNRRPKTQRARSERATQCVPPRLGTKKQRACADGFVGDGQSRSKVPRKQFMVWKLRTQGERLSNESRIPAKHPYWMACHRRRNQRQARHGQRQARQRQGQRQEQKHRKG